MAAVIAVLWLAVIPTAGQAPAAAQFPPYRAPRTGDGKPDLNGIWQALTTANFDIEAHEARPGLHPELEGAYDAQHAGQSIVEGGVLPYRPEMLAKKRQNVESRAMANPPHGEEPPIGDPELKCWMPGVPRATYMPFPFQIVQTPDYILLAYEFNGTSRIVRMNWKEEAPVDSYMGWSRGHWEGETLVVDVTGFNDQTWFDRTGNFHSDALHVVERYTALDPHHLLYEATIEDPNVFTRPWKMSFPLYRRVEKDVQVMEFKCVPFVEELLYGKLVKKPNK
jgi:hypothetical protein